MTEHHNCKSISAALQNARALSDQTQSEMATLLHQLLLMDTGQCQSWLTMAFFTNSKLKAIWLHVCVSRYLNSEKKAHQR